MNKLIYKTGETLYNNWDYILDKEHGHEYTYD